MPNDDNSIIEPEDTNAPTAANGGLAADAAVSGDAADVAPAVNAGPSDPIDEIPVPIVMEPAEIDERAQVVEALRGGAPQPRADDSEMRP